MHRDGHYRHVWDRARAVYDEKGRPIRVVGFTIDITALRRAEIALNENESRLRQFADSDIIGVIFGDIHGGISYANDEYLRIIGYSREEFDSNQVGWSDVTPPEWLPVDERAIEQARSGDGTCTPYEKEYLRKDGSRIPVLIGFTLFGEGETVAFILDISEQKNAQQEIRRLNRDVEQRAELLQTLFDVLPVGIAIAEDPACRKITVNPAFSKLLRIPPESNASLTAPEGERPETFKVYQEGKEVSPDNLPMQVAAARGGEFYDIELDVVFADGSSVKLLEYVAPLLDEEGRPRGAVGAFLDITARKQVESKLKDADRRKDEFLAMLAHELRNPLAAVSHSLQLFRAPGITDQDRSWACDIADRQLQNLKRLIDDLLDVSRITSGKIRLSMQLLDASTIVARAVETMRPFIERRGHQLKVSVAPVTMPITGDPTRLEQILANLLNNAAKYSDEGSQITIGADREGGEVVFRVRDTGVGIAPEMLSKIFEMFAQANTAMDRSQGGLGIGLTLVRSLTEMHGGHVSATSEGPGKGSEFVVRIPLASPVAGHENQAQGISLEQLRRSSRSCRILLVDDSVDTLRSMARLLKLAGHDVVTAQDGPSAIAAARHRRPEVVLLDLGLPGMNGFAVAEALRGDGMTEAMLIAVSGYAQDKDRELSRRAGFDHHLSKPVDLEMLFKLIEQWRRISP